MNQENNNEQNTVTTSFLAAMSSDDFWEIVQKCKEHSDPADGAEEELGKLQPLQVAAFKWHLENFAWAAFSQDMWGAAYLLYGGCGDDGFEYFLYGLVSQGKKTYENALRNPDSLAELWGQPDISNEGFCYVPREIYEDMTGQEIPSDCWNGPGIVLSEYISDTSIDTRHDDWDFDDATECAKRLPKLSALYFG
jgi:hypothetical protein